MKTSALLDSLEACKRLFGQPGIRRLPAMLKQIARRKKFEPSELGRLHEALLFFRAYAPSREVLLLTEQILGGFSSLTKRIQDMGPLEEPDMSGIAGTTVCGVFTRSIVRHLVRQHGADVSIAWEAYDQPERLAHTLQGLLPYYADEALVEAHVPYRRWVESAGGLPWLAESAECFEAAELPLRWELGDSPATRTHMRLSGGRTFYHSNPLIPRKEISLDAVPALAPMPVRKLSRAEGLRIIHRARDTSVVRYRELYGFTWGDHRHVYEYDAGRGLIFYWWGVTPDRRLPLRAYHAATIWKNGVPIGYFEALSLLERLEAGFNLYYTFREGETAWLYSKLLQLCHQAIGAQCFWLDPYQIGHENAEALDAGAFWFYRKLGFESVNAHLRRMTAREELKIAEDPAYRTPRATLRRLVRCPMIYGFPGSSPADWYGFDLHRLTLALALGQAPNVLRRLRSLENTKRAPQETEYLGAMRADQRLRQALLEAGHPTCSD